MSSMFFIFVLSPLEGQRQIPSFLILGRRNPSFLISPSRLLRLGKIFSGHHSNIYEITSLDRCSDSKKPCAPEEEPGQIIFSKN
jgi:hypothetical protein